MSLYFSVTGLNLRPFISIISCACKLTDQVIIIGHETRIEVLAIHSSASSHLTITIERAFFEKFDVTNNSNNNNAANRVAPVNNTNIIANDNTSVPQPHSLSSTTHAPSTSDHETHKPTSTEVFINKPHPLFVCLPAKALLSTLLRQNIAAVHSIEFKYNYCEINKQNVVDRNEAFPTTSSSVLHIGTTTDNVNKMNNALSQDDSWERYANNTTNNSNTDNVIITCHFHSGVVKTFMLHLIQGAPSSVVVAQDQYYFELCGSPKLFGGLLASLPPSIQRCGIHPLSSRVELRCVETNMVTLAQQRRGRMSAGNHTTNINNNNSTSLSTEAARRSTNMNNKNETNHTRLSSELFNIRTSIGGNLLNFTGSVNNTNNNSNGALLRQSSSAIISAYPQNFIRFQYFHNNNNKENNEDKSNATTSNNSVTQSERAIKLPGKVIDVKPLKTAAWLSGQLGVLVDVLFGGNAVPLQIRSITQDDVLAWEQHEMEMEDQQENTNNGVYNGRSSGMQRHSMAASLFLDETGNINHTMINTSTSTNNFLPRGMSFVMYIAAIDVAYNEEDESISNEVHSASTPSSTLASRESVNNINSNNMNINSVDEFGRDNVQRVSQAASSVGGTIPTPRHSYEEGTNPFHSLQHGRESTEHAKHNNNNKSDPEHKEQQQQSQEIQKSLNTKQDDPNANDLHALEHVSLTSPSHMSGTCNSQNVINQERLSALPTSQSSSISHVDPSYTSANVTQNEMEGIPISQTPQHEKTLSATSTEKDMNHARPISQTLNMLLKHESNSNSNSQAPLMMVLTNATEDSHASQTSHRDSVHVASFDEMRGGKKEKVYDNDDEEVNNNMDEIKYINSMVPATESTPTLIVQPTLTMNNNNTTAQRNNIYEGNENNNMVGYGGSNNALSSRDGRSEFMERYPLDFDAFASNVANKEDEDEMYGEDEDEELQQFLQSCSAMLVSGTLSDNTRNNNVYLSNNIINSGSNNNNNNNKSSSLSNQQKEECERIKLTH